MDRKTNNESRLTLRLVPHFNVNHYCLSICIIILLPTADLGTLDRHYNNYNVVYVSITYAHYANTREFVTGEIGTI